MRCVSDLDQTVRSYAWCELTLVDVSLGVVAGLVHLVGDGVLGGRGARSDGRVAVLGNRLVGLLGCLSTGALDGLSDVVGGVL